MGALVDCEVLARSLCNWVRHWELNFQKSQKFVKVWGPTTWFRGGNSKKFSKESILNLLLNKMRYSKFIYVQNPLLWTILKYAPLVKKCDFFISPHAAILGIGSWNSKRKWVPYISKGPKNFGSLIPKLGRYWGQKNFTPPSKVRPTLFVIFCIWPLNWIKSPENLIKFYSIEVGQISHFLC